MLTILFFFFLTLLLIWLLSKYITGDEVKKAKKSSDVILTISPTTTSIVFVDTETTGLIPNWYKYGGNTYTGGLPRIVQLSWIVCDTNLNIIKKETLLNKDCGYIPEKAAQIHGITTEEAKTTGIASEELLKSFTEDITPTTLVIAHNSDFDKNMIKIELWRIEREKVKSQLRKERLLLAKERRRVESIATELTNSEKEKTLIKASIEDKKIESEKIKVEDNTPKEWKEENKKELSKLRIELSSINKKQLLLRQERKDLQESIKLRSTTCNQLDVEANRVPRPSTDGLWFCTMKGTVDICRIRKKGEGFGEYKYPKLDELYEKLFGVPIPTTLKRHSANRDVHALYDCVRKMKQLGYIVYPQEKIQE